MPNCLAAAWLCSALSILTPPSPAPTASSAAGPAVVATVGGEPIYATEAARWYRRITRGRQVAPALVPVFEAQALAESINRRLVLAYARRTGSGATQAEIDQATSELKAALAKKGMTLEAYLASQKISETDLARQMAWNVTWQKYLVRYITEERLAAYFKAHQRRFDGTEICVRHLLLRVPTPSPSSPLPQAERKQLGQPSPSVGLEIGPTGGKGDAYAPLEEKARRIREEIASGKMSFEEAVREYSEGPSRDQQGRLGWITWQGPMDEAFTRAAFALEAGQISGPVRTPFGVHLIRVDQIKPGNRQLPEVRGELERALSRELLERIAQVEIAYTPVEFPAFVPHFKPGTRELVR
jgi:hypothetical protein